jgi:hypothetical protein
MALSRGRPSASESSPRGFSTRLSPKRLCLTAPVPAPVTPFDRARGAPSPWVVDGPTPAVTSHRESAEPVCRLLAQTILSVGVPVRQSPVVRGTERTRFTPVLRTRSVLVCERDALRLVNAVNGGILSLNQDSQPTQSISVTFTLATPFTRTILHHRQIYYQYYYTYTRGVRTLSIL